LIVITRKIQFGLWLCICLLLGGGISIAYGQQTDSTKTKRADSARYKVTNPYYPNFRPIDRYGDPFSNYSSQSPLFLKNPKTFGLDLQIDTGFNYNIRERIGKVNFRPTSSMSFREFSQQNDQQFRKQYWQTKSLALDGESAVSGRNLLPKLYVSPILDRIFGGSYVELVPRGFVTLDLGASFQKIQNPSIPVRQQTNGGFEFDQQINLQVQGKVGEKLRVTTNFDNNNSFDFQNNMKVEYTGFKEDLLKKLEIGNVSLPLNNSLIRGAQNLFGVKAQLQFGKMTVTAIASTQRGKQSSIKVPGNASGTAQGKPFEIVGSNYDENRHFFLGQFFRDNFEKWLSTLPQITSGINITRIEVYSVNRQNDTQTNRDIVAFMDAGESDKIYRKDILTPSSVNAPCDNNSNNLFQKLKGIPAESDNISQTLTTDPFKLVNGTDFEKITSARKLSSTEFTFNNQLGYITLQRKLQNDEALAVAFEYTYQGRVYKVGELTEDYSNKPPKDVVYLKLLRPRKIAVKDGAGAILPTWYLMMKNIYSLNVTQLTRDGFQLRMIYRDDRTGLDNPNLQDGVITRSQQLIQVFGLDRLNPYNDPQPDGNFDFVEGITVNTANGLIIFPYLEPLNNPLRNLFKRENNAILESDLRRKYVYDTLYNTTKADAELVAGKNKFFIVGSFRAGGGKEIVIQGFNISQGSVKVFSGGTPLREGVDYSVDYTFGKVTILNEGYLNSGKDIEITYEQQDPFAFQTRSLLGTRFDYKLSEDINLGATFLYYNERPLISRNQIGSEPARNIQYGLDFNIRKDSRILTKMVDALPFLQTKEKSTITVNAEFAQLLPGTSNVIDGEGTSFIDDFENTITPYSLLAPQGWKLAAVPTRDPDTRFDRVNGRPDDIAAGYTRAKLAWYQVDNLFYRESGSFKPGNISKQDLDNHYTRPVLPQEIFPFRDAFVGNFYEPVFDVAYFPNERGPYNYNPDFKNITGAQLKNNWGGITTAIRNEVDFDKANVEYVEFWLMDPFIQSDNGIVKAANGNEKSNTTGGKLIFHLGSVSEDVARDGKHGFENGLPKDGTNNGAIETPWGKVTNQQYVNNAFDSDPASRANQDVGVDGLKNSEEANKFASLVSADPTAAADPSSDDFKYFLGDEYEANGRNAKILERYKNINGLENNSPIVTAGQSFAQSGSPLPDNEDLNQDNTLSDLEEYYTYEVNLPPPGPNGLQVGKEFVVDKITPADKAFNGEVTWYLFRIPVRNFKSKVGDINGFKSIRYARMIVTEFQDPVVLRFANFRMVGNRWRRYAENLEDAGLSEKEEPNIDNFTVSAVNIEDNGQGSDEKPGYVEPLRRDRDITSVQQRRLNEQSVQLCVTGLADGDARAVYKNVQLDLFNYGRIKMFLSAYSTNLAQNLKDNELKAFLRLGTDFDENYYEIELPLKITPPDPANSRKQEDVWPDQNQIDLDLNDLYALKVQRDREGYTLAAPYPQGASKLVGKHGIRLVGRPDLAQVRALMIGIRNPRSSDTKVYDVCMWANELRLTEFDQTAGWAGNVVVNTKLADLGNISGSFRYIGFGYGGVQSKIAERARGETNTFDISGSINLDKLLPPKLGLKIPMFFSYESNIINPNFDPANPDVRLAAALKSFDTEQKKEDYLRLIQDRSFRRSLNFTNVRKVKVNKDAKQHIYDIENFAFTYAFSEQTQTNFSLNTNIKRNIKGAVAWQYNSKFKGFEPFKDLKLGKGLQLIKDFNFNPMPTSLSVRWELDRSYNELTYRSSIRDVNSSANQPNYQKFFVFNRYYNARWSLTKSLTLDYNATVNAIIDEPNGDLSSPDSLNIVINNLKKLGRIKYFEQSMTANYKLPFDKLPITNFLDADYRYNAGYNFRAGPIERNTDLQLGNIIQNSRLQAVTGKVDMVKLYNKIGFLKNVNTPPRPIAPPDKNKPAVPDTVRRPPDLKGLKTIMRLIMSVRSINGTYTLNEGTILPGFTESPKWLGMDQNWNAPGWGFILGEQDPNFAVKAAANRWLTRNKNLTNPFSQNQTEELNLRASVEPFTDMKIQVDARKTSNSSFQEIFRDTTGNGTYGGLSPSRSGSYRISFMSINTAFENNTSLTSDVFAQFKNNLGIIANRFKGVNGGREIDPKSQDVLIPAFIAAYSGTSVDGTSLSPFPRIPLPNWRVDYTGLNKIGSLKDFFQSITVNHAYTSNYSVVNYTNSLKYTEGTSKDVTVNLSSRITDYNTGRNFANIASANDSSLLIPVYVINQVMISESFAPLIGINARTKSKISLRFEYKTKRDISLNVSNAQITEQYGKDWSFEMGFTKNNMKLPFKDQGRTITLKNDITFLLNISLSNTETIQRRIEDVATITNGNINFQLRPNIRYEINKKLQIQAYAEHSTNEPLVTSSFPRSNTRIGFKLVFNLAP
jgi:cell surface protein SprA